MKENKDGSITMSEEEFEEANHDWILVGQRVGLHEAHDRVMVLAREAFDRCDDDFAKRLRLIATSLKNSGDAYEARRKKKD